MMAAASECTMLWYSLKATRSHVRVYVKACMATVTAVPLATLAAPHQKMRHVMHTLAHTSHSSTQEG